MRHRPHANADLRGADARAVLAYVLWHHARNAALRNVYEAGLAAFHGGLQRARIPGFITSSSHAVSPLPWLHQSASHEDWYVVEDWAALGALNERAVAGHHKTPHDLIAHSASVEAAALYGLRAGTCNAQASRATWFNKPPNLAYWVLWEMLDPYLRETECSLWQRQLALGPSPEFCILGACELQATPLLLVNVTREAAFCDELGTGINAPNA
jgi:hypothetical protein